MLRKPWHRRGLCSVRCFKNGFHQTEQNLGYFTLCVGLPSTAFDGIVSPDCFEAVFFECVLHESEGNFFDGVFDGEAFVVGYDLVPVHVFEVGEHGPRLWVKSWEVVYLAFEYVVSFGGGCLSTAPH